MNSVYVKIPNTPKTPINISMCANCGVILRRKPSRTDRAKRSFCDIICKIIYRYGSEHPDWRKSSRQSGFYNWAKFQPQYKQWRELAFKKYNYQCFISGRFDDLEPYHIFKVREKLDDKKAFSLKQTIVLCREIKEEIHNSINNGKDFNIVIQEIKERYNNG